MRCLLLTVALVGLGIGHSLAADAPRQAAGVGQLLVSDLQSGATTRLNLARYHVNVILHPPVALVQIDQSFYNPYHSQQEGTFVFNLPDGASVSRFAMYTTHTQLIEGELIDRARAANIYQSIVDRQRDPAILEQIGGNLFRMRVFPIPPRDTKRILLDYTVPLVDQAAGKFAFELPLMSDLEPIGDFTLIGKIRGPTVAGTPASESHPEVKFETSQPETVGFQFAKQPYRPESAFVLTFQQLQSAEPVVRSFTHTNARMNNESAAQPESTGPESSCEFLATISSAILEKKLPPSKADQPAVDVLIIADTSAATVHQRALRRTVRALADGLRKQDRFQLGCVDVGYRAVSKTWFTPQSEEAAQTFANFDREFFFGTVDFGASLQAAFEALPPAESGRRRCVIYVGDGKLPAGKVAPNDIVKRLAPIAEGAGLQFGAVLLSHDPAGRELMDRLAATTGGRTIRISGSGSLHEPLEWLSAGCPEPVRIVDVKVDGVADDDLFVPASWDSASALHIYGRRQSAGKFQLQLTLERADRREPFDWTVEAKDDPDDLFVGRLWAQRKLDQLRAQETANPQAPANREQQITLSQEWTLLNPHTAFLVLENEADYTKFGVRRSLRRQYWKPEEAIVAVPLTPDVLKGLKNAQPVAPGLTAERFEEILTESRQALKDLHPDRAIGLLKEIEGSTWAKTSAEYAEVRESARQMLARAELIENLGPQRGWFDRSRPIGLPTTTHDLVWQLVYGVGAAPTDEGPMAALLKRIPPPQEELSLEEFLGWVKSESGLDVLIDKNRLMDEGVAINQPVSAIFRGVKSMSLQSMLKNVLAPVQLTYIIDGDLLTVTTSQNAADRLDSRLYPVGDLILSTQAVAYSLLANSELDRELLVQHRLDQKLNQKISVNFSELPLEDVLEYFAEQIDDNLIIDRQKLLEEGVALDQPISLELSDKPVRQLLKALLDPVQLSTVIQNEAIVVTTSQSASDRLQTQIHAAQDIVYEVPPELHKHIQSQKPLWKRAPHWGGMMGGTGGMGMGGGFGGGGFFGGGMGGGMMGGAVGGQPNSAMGLSEDIETDDLPADVDAASNRPKAKPIRDDVADGHTAGGLAIAPAAVDSAASTKPPDRTTNADEMIDLLETTIHPDSWETLSGPGSVIYFPGALGFVVRQTQAVHTELAAFLDRLRSLPPAFTDQSGLAPARPRLVGANDIADWEPELLVKLLQNVIEPDTWEELSGPGTIAMHTTKLTLVVRQTQAVHDEILSLLTSLRRARYLARRGRVWKTFDVSSGPWFPIALGVTDLPQANPESAAAAPDPAELKALEVLAEPLAGEQNWRSTKSSGRPSQTTVIRISAGRTEFEMDGRLTRVENEEAAVAYPGLSLVERGPWGTALRRIVDGRLPWLPHRSRRELAKLFAVKVIAQNKQTVQLKLAPPEGAPGDDIAVTVDRKTGLATLWESRIAGQTVLRLRFSDLRQAKGKPTWAKVVAEDSAGHQIEQWDLISYAELKTPIPALEQGWQNSVLLDLRAQDREDHPPLIEALQAIRSVDSGAVDRALAAALVKQPRQPLVSFLKAWNLSQRPGHEEAILLLLTDVARSGAFDLIRNIADGAFLHVSAREMYAVLLSVPEKQRTAADWDHLARMAVRARQPAAALAHVKSAIAAAGSAGDTPERVRLQVQLLLDSGQSQAAVKLARQRLTRDDISAEELPALVELFSKGSPPDEARNFIVAALAHKQAVGMPRRQLLLDRAEFETGLPRWRTLVEAASLLPEDSNLRQSSVGQVTGEMAKSEESDLAGTLAQETKDPQIAAALWLAQAQNEVQRANATAAADIGWKLYEEHQLPADRFGWLIIQMHAARQHERVIWFVEDRLRAGEWVDPDVLQSTLPSAYEALGRTDAAKRARTQPRPPDSPKGQPGRGRLGGMGGGFF
jgi:hypothetical protein